MPRPLINVSKNGLTVDENRKSPSKTIKLKKSLTTTTRKNNVTEKSQERLVGGADVPQDKESVTASSKGTVEETSILMDDTKQEDGKSARTGGPCCTCMAQLPGCTGDKKVDDMIDYVHQNLHEAGKALATLSENFEHDSKLMFADILGRIQQWSGLVQNKLDICKNEIEELRKELVARACEIENLRKQLAECMEREKELAAAHALALEQAASLKLTASALEAATLDTAASHAPTVDSVSREIPVTPPPDRKKSVEVDSKKGHEVLEIVCTDAAIQSMMKDKDRMRHEMELEAEIARLRKENERIVKERAEYENAIQRALLRGVSSLNVEALRVLRCPPIPCCTPCAPCPVSVTEPTAPCKRNAVPAEMPRHCVTQRASHGRSSNVCGQSSDTVKRPCTSPCCATKRNRKPTSNNSMVFLLHQGDTKNICMSSNTPMPGVCGSPVMKKIEIPPCPRFNK